MNINLIKQFALNVRNQILDLTYGVGKQGVHLGSSLSVVDILAVLYGGQVLKYNATQPSAEDRDYFILSKGHAYAALYATLCESGFFTKEELQANFMTDNGLFPVHPVMNINKGIEFSGGSLGTGISFAVGKALALKKRNKTNKVYVLLGDGECNEGSVWEALMSAAQLKLDNLIVLIDHNHLQQDGPTEETLNIDLVSMTNSAGLCVAEIDGHDYEDIFSALLMEHSGQPLCIVANTIKGKGVEMMENNNAFHHAFLTERQYTQAKEQLNSATL